METTLTNSLKSLQSRPIVVAGAIAASSIASFICYTLLKFPFLFIGVIWILAFGMMAAVSRSSSMRLVFVYLAWGAAALSLAELWFWIRNSDQLSVEVEGGFTEEDLVYSADYGCVPASGRSLRARKLARGELIYDVEYEIDDVGLRAYPNRGQSESILFFGGSIMFGEGLDVEETMPFKVSEALGLRAYNFGFPGYGPHQVLRTIESGRVENVVKETPKAAVFITFANHILRMAGKVAWDPVGPKYVLNEEGEIEHMGSLSSSELAAWVKVEIHKIRRKSTVYRSLFEGEKRIRDEEIELFAKGTKRMEDLLRSTYPDIEFHVIVFDFDNQIYSDDKIVANMMKSMEALGVNANSTRDIFSGYDSNPEKYHISKYDSHPSSLANRELAKYLVDLLKYRFGGEGS